MTVRYVLYKWIELAVAEIWPFEIIQDGGLPPTWIWCNRKQCHSICRPWKHHPRTKHKVYRITRCGDMTIRVSWGIWNPHFGGSGGRMGSAMAPFERAMVVSYRLSIVTVALSVTIRPQFAIECLQRLNQQGGGSLWAKISGCSPWSKPTNVITIHQRHRRTDRCTDRRHAIARLGTKVHCTVKTTNENCTHMSDSVYNACNLPSVFHLHGRTQVIC